MGLVIRLLLKSKNQQTYVILLKLKILEENIRERFIFIAAAKVGGILNLKIFMLDLISRID